MHLPREKLQAIVPGKLDFSARQILAGLGGSPWHVAVVSMLDTRNRWIVAELFRTWPTPAALALSDEQLQDLIRPLGLYRQRARQLQRMSALWDTPLWADLRDFPGVTDRVANDVEMFACMPSEACTTTG